jgi:LytS/YehU family sensor histidine kinase
MTLTYFNIYYLMPKYVYTRRFWTYSIIMLVCLYVMLLVKYYLTYYLVSHDVWREGPGGESGITIDYAVQMMLGELYVVSFVTSIKVTIDWLKEHNKLHELEKRQLTTELRFLRSQISPHFFFNTLNNIYSLTLEKSNKAPEIVLKLSELMRYLLYDTRKKRQDLKSEVDCIQNYLDLERIRFDNSLHIDVSISGDLEDRKIAPMLLIPLVENCFKHGANKNISGKMKICMDFKVHDDILFFKLSNTIPNFREETQISSVCGGIGISNVKKRLELGYDENDYDLTIYEKDKMFYVNLKLRV